MLFAARSYRRIPAALLALVTVLVTLASGAVFLTVPARAAEPPAPEEGEQVYLYNFDYDFEILHSDFADEDANEILFYPASTVKLMTGLIACEELGGNLDRKITATARMLDGVSGNNMGLKVGETVTVKDLLYGLLANCANDAAQVLAYEIAGDVDMFVELMNEKARVLGMFHTTYKNATGMHNDLMKTSLRDTVTLAKACYANELLISITGTVKYVMDGTNKTTFRNLYNRSWLLSTYYNTSGIDYRYNNATITGLNSGYTPNGGYCTVATATKGGLSYLAVVMGGKEHKDKTVTSYELTHQLFDYAFEAFERREVLADGALIDELPVELSSTVDFVKLAASVPDGSIYAYLPTDIDFDEAITYSWYTKEESLRAPVKKGTVIGAVTVRYNGETIGSADLVAAADVERSDFLYMLSRIKSFTGTKFFIVAIVSFVVLFGVYLVVEATKEERAARRKHTAGSPVKISVSGGRSLPGIPMGSGKKTARTVQKPQQQRPTSTQLTEKPAQPPRARQTVRPSDQTTSDDAIPVRRTAVKKPPQQPKPPQR